MATKTRKMIGHGLVICFFFCLISGAQSKSDISHAGILAGDVADEFENAPIPQAMVFLRRHPKRDIVTVDLDSKGKFESKLKPGLYDVFVSANGFAPSCKVVSIEADKTTKYLPRLGPDLEHMQEGSSRVGQH